MKNYSLLFLALIGMAASVLGQGERLGNLDTNSIVNTQAKPYLKDGFPVFEVRVPDGYTEVQVRASLTNFEPGFLFKKDGTFTHNYIWTDQEVNGKREYRALGTQIFARWNTSPARWEFGQDGVVSTDDVEFPWLCTNFTSDTGSTYLMQKELFVYRFCTTGPTADASWGTGSGDPDAWVFFTNQLATPGSELEFKRQKWDQTATPDSSLTAQLQPGGTPGFTVMFQPGRGNLGAAEWMQENKDRLIWIYQVENVGGKPQNPNGTDVWNTFAPLTWRINRFTLTP